MQVKKRLISLFGIIMLTLFLCLSLCIPYQSIAESEQLHSINLICRKDDMILKEMKWNLYRIGERDGDKIVLTDSFSDYPVDMSDLSDENIELKAKTLESYAVADGISPITKGETNESGELSFDGLSKGVYLAVGSNLSIDYTIYVPSSLILEVSDSDVSFSYDAFPKFMYATLSSELTAYTVKKVWINDNPASIPLPTNVIVELFRNGELYDTVVLNEENKWEHRWIDLDNSNRWHVVERNIPVNYTVLIDYISTQYLIKNSYSSTDTSSTVTGKVTSTSTSTATNVSTTKLIITSTKTTVTSPPATVTTLPPIAQTGQLWWPVIVFAAAGLLLIIIGLAIRSKKDSE